MIKGVLTVRNVDEQAWRKFKAKIAQEKLKAGEALTQAIETWVKEKEAKEMKPNAGLLLKARPLKVGKKKVRWSEEIDETLYGLRKW
jgi:fatty acid/phospholipid biosynthesis enzyme